MSTPQGRVAQHFMDRKGLGELRPYNLEKLDNEPCWYFYYELPEGHLELEVSWAPNAGWDTQVTSFTVE